MRSTERRGVPQWLGAMQLRRGRVRVHGAVHGAVWSSPNVTFDIGVSTSMYTSLKHPKILKVTHCHNLI